MPVRLVVIYTISTNGALPSRDSRGAECDSRRRKADAGGGRLRGHQGPLARGGVGTVRADQIRAPITCAYSLAHLQFSDPDLGGCLARAARRACEADFGFDLGQRPGESLLAGADIRDPGERTRRWAVFAAANPGQRPSQGARSQFSCLDSGGCVLRALAVVAQRGVQGPVNLVRCQTRNPSVYRVLTLSIN